MVLVARNWRAADLDEQERVMLEFCEKLTLDSARMTEDDVQALRDVGFDDAEILAIVNTAAYRNYISRVADALGVDVGERGDPEVRALFD